MCFGSYEPEPTPPEEKQEEKPKKSSIKKDKGSAISTPPEKVKKPVRTRTKELV